MRQVELAALYASGALGADERAAVETRIASGDEALRAAIHSLSGAIEAVAPVIAPRPHVEPSSELVVLRGETAQWIPLGEGFEVRTLFVDVPARRVTLVARMSAGATYPPHFHQAVEECLVLEGDLHVGEYVLGPGDYQRAGAGSWHAEQHSEHGCVCLVIAPLSAVPLPS